ncbi:uncharacterized protein TM35_000182590 [Trypanosoma theileri]|uniref:PH domain-containing protein n=1 Tax=Trypanosoma theileri TaxID=67003 RepID=A0A1X0NU40_9TRYP|nr:uncharacterized protein TM35_000182590 [Trypanosoma theileri]ORC88202.1 hypothetical protein TM35_000182590 [Trypanosoma theileri]
MGTAFSAEVSDTRELANAFLDTFGREYEKLYVWEMVQHVRRAMQREAETSGAAEAVWRLYFAPYIPVQMNDRDSVMAAKLSKHLKHWNPRYFVLRGDFLLNYYESRNNHVDGKPPLGTVNLGSVVINRDATQAAEERLDKLAALCSTPRTEISAEPEKYPDMTVELYHPRRGSIYLQFPMKDRYEMWCNIFERVHWLIPRVFTMDGMHRRAFIEAFRRARVMCGLPDSLEFSGPETTSLQDAVTELVDTKVVPKLLIKLSSKSWRDRISQLHSFQEKTDELLKNYVSGKWHAIQGRSCGRRVLIEARVRDNMEGINAFEEPLREEMHNYTCKETLAFIAEYIEPPLRELAALVAPRLRQVYASVPRLYEACVSQGKVHYEAREDRMFLVSKYNSIGECYECERELWELRDVVAAQKAKFNGRVFEWLVLQDSVIRILRRVIANSIFTFETVFEQNKMQRPWDDAFREVRTLVEADSRTMTPYALSLLLYNTAVHYFCDEHVHPSLVRLKAVMITPLENRVTEELRPFIPSIQEIVVDVLLGDLRDVCRSIAESALAAA